jgi:hypothetical protein
MLLKINLNIDDSGLPGLRGSPRISNQQYACSSFLCRSVSESSFFPPDPDDPRRCSTGVKKQVSFSLKPVFRIHASD